MWLEWNISIGMCLFECRLSLEINLVGESPEGVSLNCVAGNFLYFIGKSFIIKEWDIGKLVLLEVVSECWVSRSYSIREYWDRVDVLAN